MQVPKPCFWYVPSSYSRTTLSGDGGNFPVRSHYRGAAAPPLMLRLRLRPLLPAPYERAALAMKTTSQIWPFGQLRSVHARGLFCCPWCAVAHLRSIHSRAPAGRAQSVTGPYDRPVLGKSSRPVLRLRHHLQRRRMQLHVSTGLLRCFGPSVFGHMHRLRSRLQLRF